MHQYEYPQGTALIQVSPSNPRAFDLYHKSHHTKADNYQRSRKTKTKTTKVTGPGQSIVLMNGNYNALIIWHRNTVKRWDNQEGVNCAIFRNESEADSSKMLLDAEKWVKVNWPDTKRLFTYVGKDSEDETKEQVIYFDQFEKAGWSYVGLSSKHKLILMEKFI